jgi:hypothetical protein
VLLSDRMPYKHVIAGLLKSGLGSDRFWARNPPPSAMYYFFQTTISIAGPLKKIIARACCVPAMDCGRRSGPDL